MELHTLEKLLLQNKPEQIVVLEELLALFSQSPHLSHAFVRGSITRNALDRASDLDLVLAIDDEHYVSMIESLDTLMNENFNTLFPGWLDSIVADFGGLGFVYVIERNGLLMQIDLYVLPSSRASTLPSLAKSKLVYRREGSTEIISKTSVETFVHNFRKRPSTTEQFFVGAMVLALLIRKRIKRNQTFLNYSETHLLNTMIRKFVRSISDPAFTEYGWYHIQENLSETPEGNRQLAFLESLVCDSPVHSAATLKRAMHRFLDLARDLSPEIPLKYDSQLDCFFRQCGWKKTDHSETRWN